LAPFFCHTADRIAAILNSNIGDRPNAGMSIATGTVFTQAPFHLAQKNSQHGTLQVHITLQEVTQAFG
jgi:hypothetical protein